MKKNIVIVGSGFAGMWAALSASRLIHLHGRKDINVTVIAPDAELKVPPRFYEDKVLQTSSPLRELYEVSNVNFIKGKVKSIGNGVAGYLNGEGEYEEIGYNRLVLATGSELAKPELIGTEYAFNIDQIESAHVFEQHLNGLSSKPETEARNTVVVCGGGLTGIELATELPKRLSKVLPDNEIKVVVVELGSKIAGQFSDELSNVIAEASDALNVEWLLGEGVERIAPDSVTLTSGRVIPTNTVVLTAGVAANAMTRLVNGNRDGRGRLQVDENLRVVGCDNVYATGDVAAAKCDSEGRLALMTCQHAIPMGKFAGNNVAADLIGIEPIPYQQTNYVTCIDLGDWGAVYTETWDQNVKAVKEEAKKIKISITNELIYPPEASRDVVLKQADPLAHFV